ncbi:hypothetical protein GQX74_003485 [Glossina fuscipes]|nr:hypothetical protein GQX74_003485 [Glossina fuscipes]
MYNRRKRIQQRLFEESKVYLKHSPSLLTTLCIPPAHIKVSTALIELNLTKTFRSSVAILKHLLQPGAGTIRPEIISSLITGGSVGGGGQTNESIISSVTRIIPARSGGSVRDELTERKYFELKSSST